MTDAGESGIMSMEGLFSSMAGNHNCTEHSLLY